MAAISLSRLVSRSAPRKFWVGSGIAFARASRTYPRYKLPAQICPSCTARRHFADFGAAGVQRTREALLAYQFVPLGTARALRDLPEIFVWQGPGNLRVGFWAAAKASRELATRTTAGVEPATTRRAAKALARMADNGVTFSVALLHAGSLRTNRPSPEDVTLLRALARCGFDLVAAAHSHRIAGFESVPQNGGKKSFCFYGLGSLVSGYIASEEEREGLVVIAGFDSAGNLAEIGVRPVFLPIGGFGEVPSAARADSIMDRFNMLSTEIRRGSYRSAFYRDVSVGLIDLYLRDAREALRESGVRGLVRKAARLRFCHVKRLVHRVFAT
ncbi:MAG TPA: CapA family protein [Candidatus Acidoferrales bacterium]|nr:CapA family protein [Candidatus Acidoferrales bacterium]